MPKITPTVERGTCAESKIGSISSEVERNTARSVPIVMAPAAYRLEAAPEKPHWGIKPLSLIHSLYKQIGKKLIYLQNPVENQAQNTSQQNAGEQ